MHFLENYCNLYQLPIVGQYRDEAISGTVPLDERPDGSRLLQDAQTGPFETVLFFRIDRFARSLKVLLDAEAMLQAAGASMRSATEPFDSSTAIGRFLLQLIGSMAELEKSTIVERLNMGRDRVTRTGKWLNGPVPFGYMLDQAGCLIPSTRLVEPLGLTEADVVRDLYARLAAGSSATAEARRILALGIGSQRVYSNGHRQRGVSHWSPGRMLTLIKSPIYKGVHVFRSRFGDITREVPRVSQ